MFEEADLSSFTWSGREHRHDHGQEHPPHTEWRTQRDIPVKLEVKYAINSLERFLLPDGRKVREQVKLRSYNGGLMGPPIVARPGDTLVISLANKLPANEPPPPVNDPNIPHGLNVTNLHYHGLHVSPAGNADNVLIAVKPGEHFHYEVKIPTDHQAGTFWYHAHKHGSVAFQLANGMAGPLIILGDIDEYLHERQIKERLFFFQQIIYEQNIPDPEDPSKRINGLEDPFRSFGPNSWRTLGLRFTINGEVEPTLVMRPGEVQRWRLVHAGTHEQLTLRLAASQDRGAPAIAQYQIAHDGITIGRLDQVDTTELHPGYRTDVLVSATDTRGKPLPEGTYWLMDEADPNPSLPNERRVLARILVRGPLCSMKLPPESDLAHLAPFKPIDTQGLELGKQQVVFDFFRDVNNQINSRFLINGKPFDPNAPPLKLELGAVDEWFVSSIDTTSGSEHSFHIHVNPFQLETKDKKIIWKDTIHVPRGETLRLLIRYARYIGVFPIHCHVAIHEDFGMMQLLEVGGSEHHH